MVASRNIFAWSVAVVFLLAVASPGYAGPCSDEIDRMAGLINDTLGEIAASGTTGLSPAPVQPTPRSMAAAEEKQGKLSPQTVDAVRHAMERARAADAADDKGACEKALADARQAIGPLVGKKAPVVDPFGPLPQIAK